MDKSDILYRLIWMSRPLMQAAEACVERGLTGTGLTVRMRAVLEILADHGPASVPDLAARLDIKRQYVQLMVNETMAAGLIQARANPRHKSSLLFDLTGSGRALIDQVMAQERQLADLIGAPLDAADLATALRIVTRIHEKLIDHAKGSAI